MPDGGREDPVAFLLEDRGLVAASASGNGQRRSGRGRARQPQPAAGVAADADAGATELPHGSAPSFPVDRSAAEAPHPKRERWSLGANVVPRARRTETTSRRVTILTVVDQGASSVSNFALAFIVAHYSGAHVLGVFAVLQAAYIIAQTLVRGMTSDCLLTRHEADDAGMERYERGGFASAVMYACAASVVLLAASMLLSHELRVMFVIFAVAFPLMACQDYARYIGISRYRPEYAIVLDVAWLLLFVVAYVALRHTGHVSLPWIFGAWAGAGAAVGLFALWNHATRRDVPGYLRFWYRSEHAVGLRFAGQTLVTSTWAYIVINLFILIFSISVIGEFKLAQLIFGPVTVLVAGVLTAMIAQAARAFAVDSRRALRFVAGAGVLTFAGTLVWTALIYAAPVHTMTKVLGPTWPAARHLVPAMGLAMALASLAQAATTGLRSIRAAKESLRLVVCMVPVLFTFCIGAGALWGVEAAVLALCAAYLVYVVAGWALLVRTVQRFHPDAAASGPPSADDEQLVVESMLELAEH